MKMITSAENRIYKAAVQLKQKKYRDEQSKYLIEGPNLIREALNNGGEVEILICSGDYDQDVVRAAEAAGIQMMGTDSRLFQKLSDTETPQGILAVARKKVYSEKGFLEIKKWEHHRQESPIPSNIIVLDRLQDPGNIGTILRTADAAGYMGAILLKGTADIYSPKIVRAAAGSLFRLPVFMTDTPEHTINLLRKHHKKIICTAPGNSRDYYDVDLQKDCAVIIGNEGNGVCNEFLIDSDIQVKIPMEGKIESLNAAVAAGILMYESVRQRYQR